jgi:hypothetical protein
MLGLGISVSKISSISTLIGQLLGALRSRSTYFENQSGTIDILNGFKNCE